MDFFNIIKIHDLSKTSDGKGLIVELQEMCAIPKTIPCEKCENEMVLFKDKSNLHGWKWKCSKTIKVTGQKKGKRCNYSLTVARGTIFESGRISMKDMCIFINLWLDNSRLEVINKQVNLTLYGSLFSLKLWLD